MEGVGGGGGGADITLSLPAPLIVVTGSIWRFPYVNQCWPKTQDDIKQFDKYHVRVSSVDWKRMLSPTVYSFFKESCKYESKYFKS